MLAITEPFKKVLTDIVLRFIYLVTGTTLAMKFRYRFMYFARWEPQSSDPNSDDYFVHARRAYLREPEWHVDWSFRK